MVLNMFFFNLRWLIYCHINVINVTSINQIKGKSAKEISIYLRLSRPLLASWLVNKLEVKAMVMWQIENKWGAWASFSMYMGDIWGLFYKICTIPLLLNIIYYLVDTYICTFVTVSEPSIAYNAFYFSDVVIKSSGLFPTGSGWPDHCFRSKIMLSVI